MTTEVAHRAGSDPARPGQALAILPDQTWWTPVQVAGLVSIGLGECPDQDRMAFLHLCQATGLDPFRREVYLIGRKEGGGQNAAKRWTPQTGIDGFRKLAMRTGRYSGRCDIEWCGKDGVWTDAWLSDEPPAAARATAYVMPIGGGSYEPVTAVAIYREYVPMEGIWEGVSGSRTKVGEQPTAMWRKMPAGQLGKCAEALALRRALPDGMSGLHTADEMAQADSRDRELDREQQREQLAARPWAQPAAVEPGTGGAVLLAPPGREQMWAELVEQAAVMGIDVAAYTKRWRGAHGKNIEDATDRQLAEFVQSRRDMVAAKAAEPKPEPDAEQPAETPDAAPAPAATEQAPLDVEVVADAPAAYDDRHPFWDVDEDHRPGRPLGLCGQCDQPEAAPIHRP